MKTCSKCKIDKPHSEYSLKSKSTGTLQSYCKDCQNSYAKNHYKSQVSYYVEKARRQRKKKADFIREARSVPCADCGQVFPFYMMEFDHRNPGDKDFNVASMSSASLKKIRLEIEKCDVVCANHHRERTFLRN